MAKLSTTAKVNLQAAVQDLASAKNRLLVVLKEMDKGTPDYADVQEMLDLIQDARGVYASKVRALV